MKKLIGVLCLISSVSLAATLNLTNDYVFVRTPTNDCEAANKSFVVATAGGFVPGSTVDLGGGTLTNGLTIEATNVVAKTITLNGVTYTNLASGSTTNGLWNRDEGTNWVGLNYLGVLDTANAAASADALRTAAFPPGTGWLYYHPDDLETAPTATDGSITITPNSGVPDAPLSHDYKISSGYSNAIMAAASTLTNGLVTASITNGLASPSITNGLVTAAATNGLATASITNGLVTASITNGLWNRDEGTNWVAGAFYPVGNPSNYVTAGVTNGLATASITNGLASPSVTNGLVTSAVTNGLEQADHAVNTYAPISVTIPAASNAAMAGATAAFAPISVTLTNGGASINGSPITNGASFTITGGGGGGISNVVVNGVAGVLSGSGSNVLSTVTLVASDVGAVSQATLDTTYLITNTVPFTNTIDFSVTGLVANKVTLHDCRMFLSLTNGSPATKRATIGMFRNSNRRCDCMVYLDTNQLYYSVLTTVAGVAGESSNVVADASGSVVNDLYYKAIDGTETNDYQRVQSASATAIIWQCTNLFNSGIGTLISHVNQFGGFPYYDANGSSSIWFRLTFNTGYTGTVRTVINYGR